MKNIRMDKRKRSRKDGNKSGLKDEKDQDG